MSAPNERPGGDRRAAKNLGILSKYIQHFRSFLCVGDDAEAVLEGTRVVVNSCHDGLILRDALHTLNLGGAAPAS